ncbi:MAG: hypothetical protein KME13_03090 [Myxacorys californica WJT36-NPBG1]|jgi:hypothetical protein|nr:hypothetical protein [Myxacorys californica WJT36-NPBG1]
MQTPTYEEVLDLAQRLNLDEQVQLLQALSHLIYRSAAVEGSDEVISPAEIAESEAAIQDYLAGRDRGISSKALRRQLLGEHLG